MYPGISRVMQVYITYPKLSWDISFQKTCTGISQYKLSQDICCSAAAAARDDNASPPVRHMSQQQPSQVWLEYSYRKHHPALQWLPTKLAEWIANNMQDELIQGGGRLWQS